MKTLRTSLVLLALATSAFAQDNNNAAKLAIAREAIAAMQVDKMFDSMSTQMKQMASQMAQGSMPPDATPAQLALLQKMQGKIMDMSMESAKSMIAQMDQIYADVYSETELKAMVAFFKSPEGQSMLAKQPQVLQRIMPLMQSMQRDLMPKIQQLVEESKTEIQAVGIKTP